jgi:acetolactate synthase-1/2/3 large subunit
VLSNGGYLSIRQTQNGFFAGRHIGEGPASGVTFPDIVKVASAYGIPAFQLKTMADLENASVQLRADGPALFDVCLDAQQGFEPRLRSRILPDGRIQTSNLEDMYPFLDPEELDANMLTQTKTPQ